MSHEDRLDNSGVWIPLRVHVILVTVGFLAIGAYSIIVLSTDDLSKPTPERLIFNAFLGVVGACVAAYAAVFARRFSQWRIASTEEQIRADRLNRTFEFLRQLDHDDMVNKRIQIRIAFESGDKGSPIKSDNLEVIRNVFKENDSKLRHAVGKTLGSFEDLSLACRHGYVDEGLVFKSFGFVIKSTYHRLIHWIVSERNEADDQGLYVEFTDLATAWGKKESIRGGPIRDVDDGLKSLKS